jgi:hypothetical protein
MTWEWHFFSKEVTADKEATEDTEEEQERAKELVEERMPGEAEAME